MNHLPGLDLPVGSVWCIGRNYGEHARELGNPVPAAPLVFLKPASSLLGDGGRVSWPEGIGAVHHEVELVVAIGRGGRNIAAAEALRHVAGYAVGIDLTARDLQERAKAGGLPWTEAKGLDGFAPVSAFVPATSVADPGDLRLELLVNGRHRQDGRTGDMIWGVGALIQHLSARFSLRPGDLIFTGTPAGVGPLEAGDRLEAILGNGLARLRVDVAGAGALEGDDTA